MHGRILRLRLRSAQDDTSYRLLVPVVFSLVRAFHGHASRECCVAASFGCLALNVSPPFFLGDAPEIPRASAIPMASLLADKRNRVKYFLQKLRDMNCSLFLLIVFYPQFFLVMQDKKTLHSFIRKEMDCIFQRCGR